MLRRHGRSSSIRRSELLVFVLAIGMVLAAPAPSRAGTPSPTELPPKVKPGVIDSRSDHAPRAGGVSSPGEATRLGFCGGDDWEPEIAGAPDGQHVYVVLAHFPGDPTCDPASGNRNRIYIQVSGDGGNTWGAPHLVADTVGGVDYPRQVDCVVTVDSATGAVYVSFLIYGLQGVQTDVAVAKSTDFGQTFTAAKVNGPECANCDHPWTVAYGNDVYTAHAHAKNQYLAHARMADRHGRRPMSCAKTSWPSRRARSWTAPTMHGSHGGTARLPAATAIRRATTGCRRLWPEPRTRPSRWCPQRRPVPNARTRRTAASLISASRTTSPSTPPATCTWCGRTVRTTRRPGARPSSSFLDAEPAKIAPRRPTGLT